MYPCMWYWLCVCIQQSQEVSASSDKNFDKHSVFVLPFPSWHCDFEIKSKSLKRVQTGEAKTAGYQAQLRQRYYLCLFMYMNVYIYVHDVWWKTKRKLAGRYECEICWNYMLYIKWLNAPQWCAWHTEKKKDITWTVCPRKWQHTVIWVHFTNRPHKADLRPLTRFRWCCVR